MQPDVEVEVDQETHQEVHQSMRQQFPQHGGSHRTSGLFQQMPGCPVLELRTDGIDSHQYNDGLQYAGNQGAAQESPVVGGGIPDIV